MHQRNPHLLSSLIKAHLSHLEQESCWEVVRLAPLTAIFADLLKQVAFASYVDLLLASSHICSDSSTCLHCSGEHSLQNSIMSHQLLSMTCIMGKLIVKSKLIVL